MASIRRGYAAQNKRLGILNPDEGGFLTDREQEEAKRAALLSRQDRGAHGEFDPASNKVRYNTTGQEGRNFLKSVDRFHGGDSWNKNLGGGSSFLQGPSSIGKDRILGMLPDSEALDDFATDKASEQGGGVDWEKLGSKQHDPFKTNYSHSDELATDPEALEEAAMDRASEMQAMSDAYPQGEGDERKQQRMEALGQEKRDRFQDSVPQEEGMWDKVKGLFSSDDDEDEEYKPLSEGKQAAVKMATSLLTAKDDPIRSAPVAGVKMGRVAFPNLLASSQRPVNPRYTNKGLG